MLGEAMFSAVGAAAQELASTLSYRVSERVRIRNSRGLQLLMQFAVFAVLIVPVFIGIGLALVVVIAWVGA